MTVPRPRLFSVSVPIPRSTDRWRLRVWPCFSRAGHVGEGFAFGVFSGARMMLLQFLFCGPSHKLCLNQPCHVLPCHVMAEHAVDSFIRVDDVFFLDHCLHGGCVGFFGYGLLPCNAEQHAYHCTPLEKTCDYAIVWANSTVTLLSAPSCADSRREGEGGGWQMFVVWGSIC